MTTAASPPDGEAIIDARGHRCPTPTLRLQRALAGIAVGRTVVLLADDPMARIDAPHFVAAQGHTLVSMSETADGMRFVVQKGPRRD
jgi:tRNA 2-thiouridine synthesizing protein A